MKTVTKLTILILMSSFSINAFAGWISCVAHSGERITVSRDYRRSDTPVMISFRNLNGDYEYFGPSTLLPKSADVWSKVKTVKAPRNIAILDIKKSSFTLRGQIFGVSCEADDASE